MVLDLGLGLGLGLNRVRDRDRIRAVGECVIHFEKHLPHKKVKKSPSKKKTN